MKNEYGYEDSPVGRYTLRRDGKDVMSGTEGEVWKWIQSNHCYSVSHAVRHEGYSIVPHSSCDNLAEFADVVAERKASNRTKIRNYSA